MYLRLKGVIATAYKKHQIPLQEYPEVVVAGRSNVGKSSLINSLFRGEKPAKVGKYPGKTRSINFYLTEENFVIVDLPGYGYAVGPVFERRAWKNLVEDYLFSREVIKHFLLLVDIRRGLEEEELTLTQTLRELRIPFTIILTKADKVSRMQRKKAVEGLKGNNLLRGVNVIVHSSRTGEGRGEVIKLILEAVKNAQ